MATGEAGWPLWKHPELPAAEFIRDVQTRVSVDCTSMAQAGWPIGLVCRSIVTAAELELAVPLHALKFA